MAKSSVRMNPVGVIKARLGINAGGRAQQYFTKRSADYMDKYIPFADGTLRNNKVIGIDTVTYTSPYAHYQYEGVLYVDPKTGKGAFYDKDYGFWSRPNTAKEASNKRLGDSPNGGYTTAGTGSHWDKRMWSAESKELIAEVQAYISRGGKQ